MSVNSVTDKNAEVAPREELVTLTIDGIEVSVPKGTLVIRAAERVGVDIPRFCDHPLLDPVGACRQCMVEVPDMGNGRGMPKPQASCTLEAMPGMKISTQVSSPVATKAQEGMLEFLLINHPLDCPICDKGGECPLQNQALSHGHGESRYEGAKRTFPKPVNVSAQVLLDRERCVLCARCTRFSEQISGDPFIALVERGALQQVGIYADDPYDSYFSGNVIQICPVGALTSASYRFQARPFDLVSTPVTCEHCAAGCQLRSDHRHYQVKRRLAGDAPEVNEEWNCDKGRFAFVSGRLDDRVTTPLVRRDGQLVPASWHEAIDTAVAGLKAAGDKVGVLPGGRLTVETAYGYSRFARAVLGTNNIDHRSRPSSDEEAAFLAHAVAGRTLEESVTYRDLEKAKKVVLVCFEPEDESPIVFLRLRKAYRKNKLEVVTIAPYSSRGSIKLGATLVGCVPGREAECLDGLTDQIDGESIILVGERAAQSPGTLQTVARLASATGAKLAWIPRRAGEIGAIEAGCLPGLLPGGRPVADATARVDVAAAWGTDSLPATEGLDAEAMLAEAAAGQMALVTAGIEPRDFADPQAVREALDQASFLVSLESRLSEVAQRADVVFPVALLEEHAGSFLNWEHRRGTVNTVIRQGNAPMTDLRVLGALSDAMGAELGFRGSKAAGASLDELGAWDGERATARSDAQRAASSEGAVLATWRQLLDDSAGNDGEVALMATAQPAVLRVSPATAQRYGLAEGQQATVSGVAGSMELPVAVVDDMVDEVVWVPTNTGRPVREALGVGAGGSVTVAAAGADASVPDSPSTDGGAA
ncbi:NADH-quinone oxidoreductase subunit G [Aestuariimicrobium ganziense]|uniref:NADH-quinone oxidoreductase subunit G n=1 Tax=Aestuariimicrobium ganziense TaxID=2773677 RepID=UPI001943AE21|nr:NADH-quinone oxidoreductase subunit G [Aestuariimicrobium ganziense]